MYPVILTSNVGRIRVYAYNTLVGRICLIKFVLSSIPLFFMSLFKMPFVVADKLVRIQRNFFFLGGVQKEGRLLGSLGKRFVSFINWGSWSYRSKDL